MSRSLQSFVEFVGIVKGEDPTQVVLLGLEDGKPKWGSEPNPKHFVRQNFTVAHEGPEDLAEFINKAFCELAMLGGMMSHKKEPHERFDFNNQVFIPMHMLLRIECVVKRITLAPENPDVLETEERKN